MGQLGPNTSITNRPLDVMTGKLQEVEHGQQEHIQHHHADRMTSKHDKVTFRHDRVTFNHEIVTLKHDRVTFKHERVTSKHDSDL